MFNFDSKVKILASFGLIATIGIITIQMPISSTLISDITPNSVDIGGEEQSTEIQIKQNYDFINDRYNVTIFVRDIGSSEYLQVKSEDIPESEGKSSSTSYSQNGPVVRGGTVDDSAYDSEAYIVYSGVSQQSDSIPKSAEADKSGDVIKLTNLEVNETISIINASNGLVSEYHVKQREALRE